MRGFQQNLFHHFWSSFYFLRFFQTSRMDKCKIMRELWLSWTEATGVLHDGTGGPGWSELRQAAPLAATWRWPVWSGLWGALRVRLPGARVFFDQTDAAIPHGDRVVRTARRSLAPMMWGGWRWLGRLLGCDSRGARQHEVSMTEVNGEKGKWRRESAAKQGEVCQPEKSEKWRRGLPGAFKQGEGVVSGRW
jgi:hypothetical protein